MTVTVDDFNLIMVYSPIMRFFYLDYQIMWTRYGDKDELLFCIGDLNKIVGVDDI